MADTLLLERRNEHTALLTFNRPERLNAVDRATLTRLHAILGELATDPALRALVITGAGRAFSAGADLQEMQATPAAERRVRAAHPELHLFQDVTRRLVALPAIVIAAINGIAVGVGAELAIAADLRIGTGASELFLSEAKRGLFQTNGVLHFLPRIVGQGRAAQWLLTAERVGAQALLQAGFLTELVPPDRLLERALELADTIAGNAPIPVRRIKRLLRRTWEVDLETMLQYEIDGLLACMASEDLDEGLRAFAEKRAPRWKGR
jgi:enoyl-CoA hydratase/carnithine racemase